MLITKFLHTKIVNLYAEHININPANIIEHFVSLTKVTFLLPRDFITVIPIYNVP